MDRISAQATMRAHYINGAPGVLVSGLVWVIAGLITHIYGFRTGFIAFFMGGVLIHPVSSLIDHIIRPKGTPAPDKALMREAMLNLPILFGGFYLAYIMSKTDPSMFYPIMAFTIGLRYLLFQRLYGLSIYWWLGLVLMAAGAFGLYHGAIVPKVMAIIGGAIELIFSVMIWKKPVGLNS